MYRDFWRLHVLAAILLVTSLGLAADGSSQGNGGKTALWMLASLVCLGVLVAPLFLMRSAKRRSGPPGKHGRQGRGSVKH